MTTGDDSINEDLPTIAEDLVVTKYKMAAEIVNSKFTPNQAFLENSRVAGSRPKIRFY